MRLSDLQRRVQAQPKDGLLNLFPNASAAYSLQSLSKFTNAVVRVRRSSDNAQQDFSENGILSGLLTQFVGAGNNGFVSIFYDQSGNGNNAVQLILVNQPLIVQNGSLILSNGKPSILFNTRTQALEFSTITPVSTFTVGEVGTFGVINYILFGSNQGFWYAGQNNAGPGGFDGINIRAISNAFRSLNQQLLSYFVNSSFFQVNVNTINSFNLPVLNSIQVNSIGRNFNNADLNFNGKISEIIIYDFNQTENRLAIEANINQRYAIF